MHSPDEDSSITRSIVIKGSTSTLDVKPSQDEWENVSRVDSREQREDHSTRSITGPPSASGSGSPMTHHMYRPSHGSYHGGVPHYGGRMPPQFYGAYAGHHDPYRGHPPPILPHYYHPGYAHGFVGAHPATGRHGPPAGYSAYQGSYIHPQQHQQYCGPQMSQASDANSITSSKSNISMRSKGCDSRKSVKSTGSTASGKRKRGSENDRNHSAFLPSAHVLRRSESTASSSTFNTTGNTDKAATVGYKKATGSPDNLERGVNTSNEPTREIEGHTKRHKRTGSVESSGTASTLSVGETDVNAGGDQAALHSPKRRKGSIVALNIDTANRSTIFKSKNGHGGVSDRSIDENESSRFRQLTVGSSEIKHSFTGGSLFMKFSTSPINAEVDATPVKKNTRKTGHESLHVSKPNETAKQEYISSPSDIPTPPLPMVDGEAMTEESVLNSHLRAHTFTPLPHIHDGTGISPSNLGFSVIAPQLSWSVAGDTPSLEDLAACSWEEHDDRKRPGSTTSHHSSNSRGLVISPHSFMLWKEEHEAIKEKKGEESKDPDDSVRLSVLSPHSVAPEGASFSSTPYPSAAVFDRLSSEMKYKDEQENKDFARSGVFSSKKSPLMGNNLSHPEGVRSSHMLLPHTPMYAGSSMAFGKSPMRSDDNDRSNGPVGFYGHHPAMMDSSARPGERVRNLRGRLPAHAALAPMPMAMNGPARSHHGLTSPIGMPPAKGSMWSPPGIHHMMSPHHHMSPIGMMQSKRKCVPHKPPLPTKFQGDMEKYANATVPEFTSLVNFPAHMSQKQSVNLPVGMRCCVMCGAACPCSIGSKNKQKGKKEENGKRGQELLEKGGMAQIPTQNKGLCTLCDVNVWIVTQNGMEIKWCKGCKNFRPWAAFGEKGLATKCLKCRDRQREKYALQKLKESKDKPVDRKQKGPIQM